MTEHYPRSGLGREQPLPLLPDVERQVERGPRWLRCSPCELRVLELAAQGYSARASAMLLGRHPETVRDHLANLRRKVGARNIPHAVALAYQDGVFTVGQQLPAVIVGGVEYQPAKRLAA